MSAPLLALVTLAYFGIAVDQIIKGSPPNALIWIGYVIANVGFLWGMLK